MLDFIVGEKVADRKGKDPTLSQCVSVIRMIPLSVRVHNILSLAFSQLQTILVLTSYVPKKHIVYPFNIITGTFYALLQAWQHYRNYAVLASVHRNLLHVL